MTVKTREDFPKLYDSMGLKVGAEVGVWHGDFSALILENSSVEVLHSIDPWTNADGDEMTTDYEEAKIRLSKFVGRSVIKKASSLSASSEFKDGTLDFVFIDGDHRYEAVKADIEAWFPKVRAGGVFSGHDYCSRGKALERAQTTKKFPDQYKKGIIRAVDEFSDARGIKIMLTEERYYRSWWIVKE